MNGRIGRLWLPALVGLAFATASWTLLRLLGPRPHIFWIAHMPVLLYLPWIASLPLAGAAGAYLCRRSGGGPTACFAAGLFPAAVWFGLAGLGLAGMAVSHQLDRPQWLYIVIGLLNWAVLPGGALLLGTAPFLIRARAPEEL